MENVTIKGNKYGLTLYIADNVTLDEIKCELAKKITNTPKFFVQSNIAISFAGKKLTDSEELEIVKLINEGMTVNIVCIIDNDIQTENSFKETIDNVRYDEEIISGTGLFKRGTLGFHNFLETTRSVIILGDVHRTSRIISKGSIVVLGTLNGSAYAGIGGDKKSFIAALNMNPVKLKIGEIFARITNETLCEYSPQIAYINNNTIGFKKLF